MFKIGCAMRISFCIPRIHRGDLSFRSRATYLLPSNKYPVLCLVLITYYTPFYENLIRVKNSFHACGTRTLCGCYLASPGLLTREIHSVYQVLSSIYSWLVLHCPFFSFRPRTFYRVLSLLFRLSHANSGGVARLLLHRNQDLTTFTFVSRLRAHVCTSMPLNYET